MYYQKEQEIINNWKSKEKPVVSICCTTFNHEKYISEAINGFLKQETDFAFEIIIRDDCSTDQTAKIIKEYEDAYPHIIKAIYETENQFSKGVKPMLIVYKQGVGKYFSLCEGDDYWTDPLKLQKQVYFLENNTEYIGCYHNSKIINENGSIVQNKLISQPKDYQERELLSTNAFITAHTVMFRNIVDFNDDFNEIPFGDMMLWHLLGYYGKVKYLNNIKNAAYRRHSGGVWSSLDQYSKFEKTLVSKNIIKNKLLSNNIAITDIDLSINKYILKNLTFSLINKDYKLYKLYVLKLIQGFNFNNKYIFQLIIKSIINKWKNDIKGYIKYKN